MSKTTKIVAALGIVAGLGVAALPAFTYADGPSVSGDVDLYVEVEPAIAMTITGDNDASQHHTNTAYQYEVVSNPQESQLGSYYERSNAGEFTTTKDTTINPDKTYFTQAADTTGVDVFAPYSAGTGSVDGHPEAFKLGPSSSYISMMPNQLKSTASTVTVYTNNTRGYNLSVKAKGDSANIIQQDVTGTPDTILPMTTDAPAVGNPGWAFKVAASGGGSHAGTVQDGFENDSAMNTSDQTIVASTAKTSGGDQWDVTYDVATRPDQANGVYKVSLTYTAATANGS